MRCSFKKVRLSLKNIGFLRFVPLIVFNIILPVLNISTYVKYGASQQLLFNLLETTQFFMPLFSVWWVVFVMREYLEADGNELLFTLKQKIIFKDIFIVFVISIINIVLLFVLFTVLMPGFLIEIIRIISACVFYFGLCYFAGVLLRSVALVLLTVLLYTILNITYKGQGLVFPIYKSVEIINMSDITRVCIPLFLAGAALTIIAMLLNKKFKHRLFK